jgi:hypothetical protein
MQTNMLNETKLNKKNQTRIKVTYKQPAVVLDPSAVSAKLLEIKETNQILANMFKRQCELSFTRIFLLYNHATTIRLNSEI